jgi:hypothetical protein
VPNSPEPKVIGPNPIGRTSLANKLAGHIGSGGERWYRRAVEKDAFEGVRGAHLLKR